jgi:spore coat protein CotH
MACRLAYLFILTWISGVFAAAVDSSALIFDATQVHAYELQFYYPNWVDSLEYYKSLPDEEYIPARFLYRMGADSMVLDSVGVRYKGNSSYNFAANSPKKPFKFSFDKYRADRRFFGVKKLNFSNGAKDPTMMREKIAYDIIRRYMPAPRAAFATITIAGTLIGLYTQVEQVDKIFLARHFKDNDFNLYKSSDNGATLLYRDAIQSSYATEYELKSNETVNNWSAFIAMLDKLNNAPTADFVTAVDPRLDLNRAACYCAFNMVVSNFDSYTGSGRNFYLYDDSSSGKFSLVPWDLNLAFGAYTNNWNVITVDAVTISNLAQRPLTRRILENDSLRQIYLRYIREMINGPASLDTITTMAGRWKPFLDASVRADSNKLHSYEAFIQNIDSTVTVVDGLTRTAIPGLTSFATKRNAALRAQLDKYLAAVQPSGLRVSVQPLLTCTMRGPIVTIRYRCDTHGCATRPAVYDFRGVRIRMFDEGRQSAASRVVTWDTRQVASGCYYVRLDAGSGSSVERVVVTR